MSIISVPVTWLSVGLKICDEISRKKANVIADQIHSVTANSNYFSLLTHNCVNYLAAPTHETNSAVVVCGARNVGKSSFCNFLMNAFVLRYAFIIFNVV